MAASALPFKPGMQVPREMTRADMDRVRDEFVRAARMAVEADFDMLELHCAHGYLLSSFITPLANQRTDEYGGSLENRLRFPLEVFRAMREVWPAGPADVGAHLGHRLGRGRHRRRRRGRDRPGVRSRRGGHHPRLGRADLAERPARVRTHVPDAVLGPHPQRDRASRTIAVGNITEPDQVNSIIAAGRADLCALARPHLADPNWTLRAAAQLGYTAQPWPVQYLTGKEQLERNLARQRQAELLGTSTI